MIKSVYFIMVCFITLFFHSCNEKKETESEKKFCGYEMTMEEVEEISNWQVENPKPYDVNNGHSVYNEIGDTLRGNMPDSLVFELFLGMIEKDEVCIDAFVPPNIDYEEKLSCILMNSKFSEQVPEKRMIRVFTYSNPDGSGDTFFSVAIKSVE